MYTYYPNPRQQLFVIFTVIFARNNAGKWFWRGGWKKYGTVGKEGRRWYAMGHLNFKCGVPLHARVLEASLDGSDSCNSPFPRAFPTVLFIARFDPGMDRDIRPYIPTGYPPVSYLTYVASRSNRYSMCLRTTRPSCAVQREFNECDA